MIVLTKKRVNVDDVGIQALFAVHPSDSDKLNSIPEMKPHEFTLKKIRNHKKHNLGFALARFIRDYLPDDHMNKQSEERTIIAIVQEEHGLCDRVVNKKGTEIAIPFSISFANMPEEQHDLIIDALTLAACAVSQVPVDDFRRNYEKYLGEYR